MIVQDKPYRPHGQICQLFDWVDGEAAPPPEVLIEGPRGTGKSRGIGEFLYETATKYPHTTIVALRRFRADLHKGFQRTFEDMVLGPTHKLLSVKGGGQGNTRESYNWPNGSRLILGHMEDPQRWYSAEMDILYWNEAKEARFDSWDRLTGSMRLGERPSKCPFRLKIADTNPDAPKHWLNQRALVPGRSSTYGRPMHRIVTYHRDNPALEPEYLVNLSKLGGVRRKRDFEGLWAGAEGAIWDCFDPEVHIVQETPELRWYIAGMDFGYRNPGCLLVCGFDGEGTGYVVAEVYRSAKQLEWWADKILQLHDRFPLSLVVADSAEPRSIDWLNERLNLASNKGDAFVQGVVKRGSGGRDWGFASREHVRSLFQDGRLFVLDDVQRLYGGPDPELGQGVPRCLTDEIGEYVYRSAPEGRELQVAMREEPDPMCADHACFVPETLIRMADGSEREIQDVSPGEFVATPLGPSMVRAAKVTGVRPVVELATWRGPLRGTPDHPFAVVGKGWITLDALVYGDTLCTWANTVPQNDANGAGTPGSATPSRRTTEAATSRAWTGAAASACTASSTSSITAQPQRAGTSTTKTATEQTTSPAISKHSTLAHTLPSTPPPKRYENDASGCSSESVRSRLSGTEARTAVLGIVNTLLGGSTPESSTPASSVETDSLALQFARRCIAPALVLRKAGEPASEPRPVIALTVDAGCYFANDLLVSNCDALIYLATAGWAADFTPEPEETGIPDWSYGSVLDHASVWASVTSGEGADSTFDDYTNRVGGFTRRRR